MVIQGYLHEAIDCTEPGHALAQERAEVVVTALRKHPLDATIGIVGHEPALSRLLARFLGIRQGDDRLAFKKGGAALIDLPHGHRRRASCAGS